MQITDIIQEGSLHRPKIKITRHIADAGMVRKTADGGTEPIAEVWAQAGIKMPQFVHFMSSLVHLADSISINGGCSTDLGILRDHGAFYLMDVELGEAGLAFIDSHVERGIIKPKGVINGSDFPPDVPKVRGQKGYWRDGVREFVFIGEDGKVEKERVWVNNDRSLPSLELPKEPEVAIYYTITSEPIRNIPKVKHTLFDENEDF